MIPRRSLLPGLMTLLPGAATAQQQPRHGGARRGEAPRELPPPPPPPPQADGRGDPAPVPNRDFEGPRTAEQRGARVDPALIDPTEPHMGATTDRHDPQAREDRLLRQPAPGARLRVPFITY